MTKKRRSLERIVSKSNLNRRTGAAPRILPKFINAKLGQCTVPSGRTKDELEVELARGIADKNSELSSQKHQDIYDAVALHMHETYGWPMKQE